MQRVNRPNITATMMSEQTARDTRLSEVDALIDELELARAALRAIPPMPRERVDKLRERISSGRYSRPETVAAIAAQILRVLEADQNIGEHDVIVHAFPGAEG